MDFPAWLLAVGACAVLAIAHMLTPLIERMFQERYATFSSFVGGVSLAYVFLYLLYALAKEGAPAIHALAPLAPDPIATMALVWVLGLSAFYVMHAHFLSREDCRRAYRIPAGTYITYNFLVGAAILEEAQRGSIALGVYTLALGLHIVFNDRYLRRICPVRHRGWPRGLLALAPLLGCLVVLFLGIPKSMLYLLLTIVAAATLINVMKEELPEPALLRPLAFLAGVGVYAALIYGTWRF